MQTQNVNDVIDHLANKLAVPASHLWGVLTRQAYAQMVPDVMGLAFIALAAWGWMKLYRAEKIDRDLKDISLGVSGVLIGIFAIIVVAGLCVDVGYLFNPEYFALQQVLKAIGGK